MAHTGGKRIFRAVIGTQAAAGQNIDQLAIADVGMQADGTACRHRQTHSGTHAGIVILTDDDMALSPFEMRDIIGGHGIEIKDHGIPPQFRKSFSFLLRLG